MRVLAFGVVLAVLSAAAAAAQTPPEWHWSLPDGIAPPPVPADNPMSQAKVELGRRLFYDADLSIDGTTSCATCHEQHRAFSEGNATHPGVHGAMGRRNVMALANVAYFDPLTWADPSLHRLEDQVPVPLAGLHPVEMGMAGHEADLTRRLSSDDCYRRMFAAAFPETAAAMDVPHVAKALAAFERTLLSFDSPYDRFQRGDSNAISLEAEHGALLFQSLDCATCHAGVNFTDGTFHAIGLYDVDGQGGYPAPDHGLKEITGQITDEGAFRTPSLRNVALTAPYMHDGSVKDLSTAIRRHGAVTRKNGPRAAEAIGEQDLADIVAFLQSLSDEAFVTDAALALPKTVCGRPNY